MWNYKPFNNKNKNYEEIYFDFDGIVRRNCIVGTDRKDRDCSSPNGGDSC